MLLEVSYKVSAVYVNRVALSLQASRMSLKHKDMETTQTEVKAMEDLREKIDDVFSDENLAFPYSRWYLAWERNKV